MPADWHTLYPEAAAQLLKSHQDKGLTSREAAKRLKAHGPNRISSRARAGMLAIFASQFKDPMVLTLLLATAVSAVMKEAMDAVVISAIVLLNGMLGTLQEWKAERSLEALEDLAPPLAWVVRDGKLASISREEVVPGDLMALWPGVRVPADGRIVSAKSLQVEEAALTGESLPVSKRADVVLAQNTPLPDRRNMVYGGTLVTRGEGYALAVATGMDTEMGRIANLVRSARSQPTPLEVRLEALGRVVLGACVGICLALMAVGVLRGLPFRDMFLTGVSLAVAAVPEGLPAVVTLSLAFGVQRMAKSGAIVRKLEAVETLGSVTVICTDKTGTLTRNSMEVVDVAAPEDLWPGARATRGVHADILLVALLASDARHLPDSEASGAEDPTEQAIVKGALGAGIDVNSLDARFPRMAEMAFSPERRMMSVKVATEKGALICVKGASDRVIPLCRTERVGERDVLLGQKEREAWDRWVEEKAGQGMRVLAVAERKVPQEEYAEDGLTLRGCLAMADPLRPEAADAVLECKRAGIRPVLITGDHLRTAESIARQAGILDRDGKGTTGDVLDKTPESRLPQLVDSCKVFARVSPAHKLRIVRALKKAGHVVAMTGDGVNDAPALKEAAVGVAMGKTGTDVAREASSMVLLDDDFSTIVEAVREGRSIYDNVRKFIRYLFSCNLGEVFTMMIATIAGLPLPLTPAELLWMNLVTDGLPALALSWEPPDPDVMDRPPRPPGEGLFSRGLWFRIVGRGAYVGAAALTAFMWGLLRGDPALASTLAYATLVTVQLVSAFDCRSEERTVAELGLFTNPLLLVACGLSWVMLFVTIQLRPLASLFRTVPLSLEEWSVVLALSVFPDLFKAAFLRRKQ